jgi:prophage antirepressor-like protein
MTTKRVSALKGISTTDTLGGRQEIMTINESGLFALIFKSRKPDALRFRKWVTGEVLPTLRRNGSYFMTPNAGQSGLVKKPWSEWSAEERRLAISEINTTKRVFNTASAVWMWGHLGLPMPPTRLLPAWWQGELSVHSRPPAN